MIEFFTNYGLFLAKTVTIVVAMLFFVSVFFSLAYKAKGMRREQVQVVSLNDKFREFERTIESVALPKYLWKQKVKSEKAKVKKESKQRKQAKTRRNRLFVLNFTGDIKASAVEALKEEVSAVLTVAEQNDEILVKLESAGGVVHSYGLAASQLMRIKNRNIPLTVSVDKVAASGGYLMACVADRIIAAPFAIVGSIGVIAQLPNFNRFLKKHDVDFEQITAGQYKRTLTVFGENRDEDREKLKEELEETHRLFKAFVVEGRRQIDIEKLATGEYWYGTRALDLQLVDELMTSDDYVMQKSLSTDIYTVTYHTRKSLGERLAHRVEQMMMRFEIG